MQIAPEQFASRRDTIAFAVCILLSIGVRAAPTGVQEAIGSTIRSTVLAPLLAIEYRILIEQSVHFDKTAEFAGEDSARVQALEALALQQENESLRSFLGLSARVPLSHVAAEVLRLHPSVVEDQTLVISAGSNKGVEERSPVVAPGGLVGVVTETDPSWSVLAVWTNTNFRVSAMTFARVAGGEGSRAVFGIVEPVSGEGPDARLMELKGIPYREEVPIGSRVVTSGEGKPLGGVFPRGIPIGTVVRVGEESEGWSRTYIVQPAVPLASVWHVIVLTGAGDDVSAAYRGGLQ